MRYSELMGIQWSLWLPLISIPINQSGLSTFVHTTHHYCPCPHSLVQLCNTFIFQLSLSMAYITAQISSINSQHYLVCLFMVSIVLLIHLLPIHHYQFRGYCDYRIPLLDQDNLLRHALKESKSSIWYQNNATLLGLELANFISTSIQSGSTIGHRVVLKNCWESDLPLQGRKTSMRVPHFWNWGWSMHALDSKLGMMVVVVGT